MPPPELPEWVAVAIAVLCVLNIAMGSFEAISERPSWLRRRLSRRGRLPATPRDWRLRGAGISLASGSLALLAIGQALMLRQAAQQRTSSTLAFALLVIGLVAALMLAAASIGFLRVRYLPRGDTRHRH